MPFTKMDPSCTIGFYSRSVQDYERIRQELCKVRESTTAAGIIIIIIIITRGSSSSTLSKSVSSNRIFKMCENCDKYSPLDGTI